MEVVCLKGILCKFIIFIFLALGNHVRERVSSNKTRGTFPIAVSVREEMLRSYLDCTIGPKSSLLVNSDRH